MIKAVRLTILLAALCGAPVLAEGPSLIDSNVVLQLGGYLLETDTTIRLDGAFDSGTEIDLEDDLGFEDADRLRFDGLWRMTPRHHLRGAYFKLDREASRRVERDFELGDIVIPVQAEVTADLDTSIWELAYEYAFLHRENYEVSASIGVHSISFDLSVAASLFGGLQTRREEAETSAPLPVVGLRGLWKLGGPVYFEASGQYFEATIDEYDGDLQNYRAAIIVAWRHVGFGAGYEQFHIDVDVEQDRFDGALRWEYGGAILFGQVTF